VVARASTDVLATGDRDLVAAIRFLREHACECLRLKELPARTALSSRTLERRVYQLLGRSPKEEIMRVRLERAKQLLTETSLPVGAVAERCGFSQAKYFSHVFHARLGLTPGEYRHSTQKRA
jgi:LacI family transcriptional regulator